MKHLIKTLGALMMIACASCENTWDSEARDLFHQGCIESAKENNMEEAAAKSMCDCRLQKAMEKYPSFSDALAHTEELMNDPDLKACK